MSQKFKIITFKNSENLHLKLTGEFDAASAWCLLDEINKNASEFENITINTDSLSEIYPFGVNIFHQALKDLRAYNLYIRFTGNKAAELCPEDELFVNCSQLSKESKITNRKGII